MDTDGLSATDAGQQAVDERLAEVAGQIGKIQPLVPDVAQSNEPVVGPDKGRMTRIEVPPKTVGWMGFDGPKSVSADLQALAERHPEYYGDAQAVQEDIAFVLEKPDGWYIHKDRRVVLFRERVGHGAIPQARVEIEADADTMRVRSVYVGGKRKIAKKMADKRKALSDLGLGGQSPDSLTIAEYLAALSIGSSRPTSTSDEAPEAGTSVSTSAEPSKPAAQPAAESSGKTAARPGRKSGKASGESKTLYSRRGASAINLSPAAIGGSLARDLVTDGFVEEVRQLMGSEGGVLLPVIAQESAGLNKIPLAVAEVLAERLGVETDLEISQATRTHRTDMDGLSRVLKSPEFYGTVKTGQRYVLVDDTLTQGGTFASLANHIRAGGGEVLGVAALSGKHYSVALSLSDEYLTQLHERFGDVEDPFRAATGYGFDALTESEGR